MIAENSRQLVVLIHGLANARVNMARLAWFLRDAGYQTVNYGYNSVRRSIDWHAASFGECLAAQDSRGDVDQLHVVSHSMGSIVTRATLLNSKPEKLHRVVMLAPPNRGSHVARWMSSTLGRVVQPLRELSDAPHSYVNKLGEPTGCEIGVVAARKDKVIVLPNTYLQCQQDHIVLPGNHAILSWRKFAAEQVIAFLRNGQFER